MIPSRADLLSGGHALRATKIRFIVTRGALRFLKIHLWFALRGLFAGGFPDFGFGA